MPDLLTLILARLADLIYPNPAAQFPGTHRFQRARPAEVYFLPSECDYRQVRTLEAMRTQASGLTLLPVSGDFGRRLEGYL